MIGGCDIVVEGVVDDADVDLVIRFFVAAWPQSVVSAPTLRYEGDPHALQGRTGRGVSELFFYRDAASRQSWQEHGLTEAGASAMVFVTFEEDAVVFVVDRADSESGKLVHELQFNLEWNRRTRRKAAA